MNDMTDIHMTTKDMQRSWEDVHISMRSKSGIYMCYKTSYTLVICILYPVWQSLKTPVI